MDPFEGVEVEIVSAGRILDFYDDPEEHEEAGYSDGENLERHGWRRGQ